MTNTERAMILQTLRVAESRLQTAVDDYREISVGNPDFTAVVARLSRQQGAVEALRDLCDHLGVQHAA